jgi:hypothetical protein
MNFPPSENESGVTLRMPITSGRRAASSGASANLFRVVECADVIAPLCGGAAI